MLNLHFVTGATNAGKSTFLQSMQRHGGATVALIEVGKALRAKYGAAHFAGQAAPRKTAAEAWEMMQRGIVDAAEDGCEHVFIDGQPRDVEQAEWIVRDYFTGRDFSCTLINLYAPAYVRRGRAEARDRHDPEKLALSLARMEGDLPALYNVLSVILGSGMEVLTFDTSLPSYDLDHIAFSLMGRR